MRWYDYVMCIVIAVMLWAHLMMGNVVGVVIYAWAYQMWEDFRVGKQ